MRGFASDVLARVARCMVPGQDSDSCFSKSRAYHFDHPFDRELGSGTEVQNPILQSAGRGIFMNERPAAIKYAMSLCAE